MLIRQSGQFCGQTFTSQRTSLNIFVKSLMLEIFTVAIKLLSVLEYFLVDFKTNPQKVTQDSAIFESQFANTLLYPGINSDRESN